MPVLPKKYAGAISLILVVLIGIALFCYTFYRAAHLSFTHDESLSFNMYIFSHASFNDIIAMKYATANNHILNTLLMGLCYHLFGGSELSLRAPNLLAHITYMMFTALLLWQLGNKWVFITGFVILNCNPYLLEFFSLARGYGLAIGFMSVSIYFFFRYFSNPKTHFVVWSLFMGILAMISNIALMYYMLGLYCAFNILFLVNLAGTKQTKVSKFMGWLKMNLPLFLSIILAFAFFYEPIRRLLEDRQLYFGGNYFWGDTVNSLIIFELYSPVMDYTFHAIKILVIGFVCVGLVFIGLPVFSKKANKQLQSIIYAFIILTVPCIATVISHYLIESKLLMTRTALFLTPLFLVYVIAVFNYFSIQGVVRYISSVCLCFIAGAFVFNCHLKCNITHTEEWDYDASEREAITAIKNDYALHPQNRQKISVGIFWVAEPALNYYREVNHYNWLEELNRDGVGGVHDYYYLMKDNIQDLPKVKLRLMAYYPVSDFYLFTKE